MIKIKNYLFFNDEKLSTNIISDIPDNKINLKEKSPQKEVNDILKNNIEKNSKYK